MEHLLESAWYCANSEERTHPVALLNPNPWGLYDMIGNVWEWVWDQYLAVLGYNSVTNPQGTSNNYNYRVIRGCGSSNYTSQCWAAERTARYKHAGSKLKGSGFRLVRTIQE